MTDQRVLAAYDAVARDYDAALRDELDAKPLDRALLDCFVELVGDGRVADVGCGPGHVTAYIAERHDDVIGVDLSPQMVEVARERAPQLTFEVGSMLDLHSYAGQWAGAVALYSVIHFSAGERRRACAELSRALCAGGWLLLAFHVDSAEFAEGATNHATSFFGHDVELDGHFLSPSVVADDATAAGLSVVATTIREPMSNGEYPSRRCYLLAQRGVTESR